MSNCHFLSQLQTAMPFRSQWNPTRGYNDQKNRKPTTEQVFCGFQRIISKTIWLSEMPQEVIGFPIYMELEDGLAQFLEGNYWLEVNLLAINKPPTSSLWLSIYFLKSNPSLYWSAWATDGLLSRRTARQPPESLLCIQIVDTWLRLGKVQLCYVVIL